MTDPELLAAIAADPQAKALADSGNDAGCAARLAASLPPVVRPLTTAQLLLWSAARGVLKMVLDGGTNANAGIASACLAVQATLNGGAPTLDLDNPVIVGAGGLIDGLTAAGILPASGAGSKADLLAFASVPAPVSAGDVSRVLLPSRPGGIVGGSH